MSKNRLLGARVNFVAKIEEYHRNDMRSLFWRKPSRETIKFSALVKARKGESFADLLSRVRRRVNSYVNDLPYNATVNIESYQPKYRG